MKRKYTHSNEVTKEMLDRVAVGDLVRINDWKTPMRVVGVSPNYFMMVKKLFRRTHYSVCEKLPWAGIRRNAMVGGMFHCGTDNWIGTSMGFPKDVSNLEEVQAYLDEFERNDTELSVRTSIPIRSLFVKAVRQLGEGQN